MKNPKWRFVKIYADEGITGTLAKKREQFIKMIRDCEKGKIDLILTKSFSRFARNTVDSLRYVRKLKALGIGVFFEEQNLNSLTADSEMFVGLYSVMAQAESENISANVRWGLQQRMRAGTFAFRYNILGYRQGEDGEPEIVPEEAEIVLKIYNLYLSGYSVKQIKEYLEQNNIPTKKGKSQWGFNVISNILTNERYFLSHRVCYNRSERRNMKAKKYLIILILKYLEANSDENHPLTQTRIAEEISGVFPCDRKTVGRNLRFLKEVGYPIKKTSRGFYLGKRLFTVEEREFVLNAVAAAPGKTQEEKAELSEKLLSVLHRLRR